MTAPGGQRGEGDVPVWCSEHMEPYCPRHSANERQKGLPNLRLGPSGEVPSREGPMMEVERVLAEVLAGHRHGFRINSKERWTECLCEARVPWHADEDIDEHDDSLNAHVAAEQAKALAVWAWSTEVVMRAAEQVHVGECGCGLGPDDMHVGAASAVLTAIFGSAS